MAATEFEIRFAQSRIDYFDKVLKKGENDKVKTLLKAIKAEGGSSFGASDIANAIKNAKETTQEDKDKAVKAADTALKAATKADTDAKAAATTAASDLTTATNAKKAADDMKVGDDPVLEAMKVYNKACGDKLSANHKDVNGDEVIACNTELLKGYGFVNAILKNLPNEAKDVLVNSGSAFNDYAASLAGDNLKAATKYALISSTVAGTGPFVKGDEIPEPKDYTAHAKHVENTLVQLNTISYALLQGTNCGSANKADLSDCYKGHATDLKAIYDVGAIDKMNIDVSATYPYGQVSEGTTLPTIEM